MFEYMKLLGLMLCVSGCAAAGVASTVGSLVKPIGASSKMLSSSPLTSRISVQGPLKSNRLAVAATNKPVAAKMSSGFNAKPEIYNKARELTYVSLVTLMSSLIVAKQDLEKYSRPLLKIKRALEDEATEFVTRVQENPEIKQALGEIAPDSDKNVLSQFSNNLGNQLSRFGNYFNNHLKINFEEKAREITERGRVDIEVFLKKLEDHSKEFNAERERVLTQQRARDALEV